jgi:hypothetical protein
MNEQTVMDAIRLLRALDDNQAHSRVGAAVMPSTAEAMAAGIDLHTSRYYAAIELLLDRDYLARDYEADRRLQNIVGDPESFRITKKGLDLLAGLREREQQ